MEIYKSYTIEHSTADLVFDVTEIDNDINDYDVVAQKFTSTYKDEGELKRFIVLIQNVGMDAPQWNPIPFVHYNACILRIELESILKERSSKIKEFDESMSKLWGLTDIDHTNELDDALVKLNNERTLWTYMQYAANGHAIDLYFVDGDIFEIMTLDDWFNGGKHV